MPRERRSIPWLKVRDGTYYVYWYDPEAGRTKRISLATQESTEAQSRYAGFLSGGSEIFGPRRDARRLDVSTALDQYRIEHVAVKVVAQRRAKIAIDFLKTWFRDTPFEDVDIPACRAYADARQSGKLGDPAAASTARRELGVLSAAAYHAERWKRIGSKMKPPTPMPSIELPPDGDSRIVFLTKTELARVFDSAEGRLKDFTMVLYFTAARKRSVERLTRFQVDLRAGTINLTSPTETANERRSKKRRPVVPIDAKIRPVVERLYAESKLANNEWLFGDDKDMYATFKWHLSKLGLADKAFPHVMRHSRASHLLQDGVPIFHVAKLLGDTVATVERVYGHLAPADLAEALEGGR